MHVQGTSYGAPCELENVLAKIVIDRVPCIEMVRFVNSGTEACLSVLRLMRAYTKRDKVRPSVHPQHLTGGRQNSASRRSAPLTSCVLHTPFILLSSNEMAAILHSNTTNCILVLCIVPCMAMQVSLSCNRAAPTSHGGV